MAIANRIKLIEIAKSHLDMVHGELEAARQHYEKLDLLLENAVEIGQIAAFLEREEKIVVENGKDLTMSCVELAKKFEKEFNLEDGDYYGQIDEFATSALIDEFGSSVAPPYMKHVGHYYNSMHGICYVPENCIQDNPDVRFIPVENRHQALYMCILYDKWLEPPIWGFVEKLVKVLRTQNA